MKLEKCALIAEIIASFAVVVTLIYLAIQVRDGTRATQAASFQVAASMDQEFLLALGSDPANARIWNGYLFAPETRYQLSKNCKVVTCLVVSFVGWRTFTFNIVWGPFQMKPGNHGKVCFRLSPIAWVMRLP
jgi:hypothetical protein